MLHGSASVCCVLGRVEETGLRTSDAHENIVQAEARGSVLLELLVGMRGRFLHGR